MALHWCLNAELIRGARRVRDAYPITGGGGHDWQPQLIKSQLQSKLSNTESKQKQNEEEFCREGSVKLQRNRVFAAAMDFNGQSSPVRELFWLADVNA